MTKEELRGQMRAMRAELTGDKREAAEQQAVDHMMAFLRQKGPRRFYPFVSCRTEIDTLQLLQRVWKELPEIAVVRSRFGQKMELCWCRGLLMMKEVTGSGMVPDFMTATLRNMDCVNRMPEEYSRSVMHFRFNLCSGWKHRSMMLHWMRL